MAAITQLREEHHSQIQQFVLHFQVQNQRQHPLQPSSKTHLRNFLEFFIIFSYQIPILVDVL